MIRIRSQFGCGVRTDRLKYATVMVKGQTVKSSWSRQAGNFEQSRAKMSRIRFNQSRKSVGAKHRSSVAEKWFWMTENDWDTDL